MAAFTMLATTTESRKRGVNMRNCLRMRSIVLTGLALSAQASAALAEPADGNGSSPTPTVELDTVTVTAQKRAEKLQEIPAAATAITMADIERAGVNNIQDVAQLTPNLEVIDQLRPGIQ